MKCYHEKDGFFKAMMWWATRKIRWDLIPSITIGLFDPLVLQKLVWKSCGRPGINELILYTCLFVQKLEKVLGCVNCTRQ